MKVLRENKGLVLFYVCVLLFTFFWVSNVEKSNDRIMSQKNAYMLNEVR